VTLARPQAVAVSGTHASKAPVQKEAPGGGKKESDIVVGRLSSQRESLALQIDEILEHPDELQTFSGQLFLVAEMFNDSFAISKAPKELFQGRTRGMLVGPLKMVPLRDQYSGA